MALPAPDPATRLSASDRATLYLAALQPRRLLATASPEVAHDVVGDAEMDAAFADLYGHELAAMFRDRDKRDLAGTAGVGFYANLVGQRAGKPVVTLDQFRRLDVPVLIIEPDCDYVPDPVDAEYLPLFPDAEVRRVPGGHLAYLEDPGKWLAAVQSALR
jgi:pimeloyl-ACP methyl ester carboxylesterase